MTKDIDYFYAMEPEVLNRIIEKLSMELWQKDMVNQHTTDIYTELTSAQTAYMLKINDLECSTEGLEMLEMFDAMGLNLQH